MGANDNFFGNEFIEDEEDHVARNAMGNMIADFMAKYVNFARPEPVQPVSASWWFDRLHTLPPDTLTEIGLYSEDDVLFLFPEEWYDDVPEGYEVAGVRGEKAPFKNGEVTRESRGGYLSFGIKKQSAYESFEMLELETTVAQ